MDGVSGEVVELVKAVGAIITPILLAWITYRTNQTHKAVNSTATILAEKAAIVAENLSAEQDKNSLLSARVARLEERAERTQQVQDMKDAAALPPPGTP